MRRLLLFSATALSACTLLTDLDGFVSTRTADSSDDAGKPDARTMVAVADASTAAPLDASVGSDPSDASDASSPPECSDLLLVGNKTLEASKVDGLGKGTIDAYGYAVTEAGRATCVWVYLESSGGAVALGVYAPAPSTGHPGALVARAVIDAPKFGWNSVKLEKPLDVPKPATFWIGLSPLAGIANTRVFGGPCGGLNLHAGPSGPTGTADRFTVVNDYADFCNALMYLSPAP